MIRKIVLLLCVNLCLACSESSVVDTDDVNANIVLTDGKQMSLQSYQGRWLLVNYWATWCAPCREEVPYLNELNKDGRFSVLGVSYDGLSGDMLQQALTELSIEFPQMRSDPKEIFGQSSPTGLPATLVVNQQGEVLSWIKGKLDPDVLRKATGIASKDLHANL